MRAKWKLWSASSSDIASAGPDQVLSKGNNGRLRGSLGWINQGIEKRPVALPVSGSASMPFSPVFSSFQLLMESGSAGSQRSQHLWLPREKNRFGASGLSLSWSGVG